jgi:hypothetical protein
MPEIQQHEQIFPGSKVMFICAFAFELLEKLTDG